MFVIIFTIAMIALAGFAFYLSRTIDHGEARFDTTKKLDNTKTRPSDAQKSDEQAKDDE